MNCNYVTSSPSKKYYRWGSVTCNNNNVYCSPYAGTFCYSENITDSSVFQVCNMVYTPGTGAPSLEPTEGPTKYPTILPTIKTNNPTGAPRAAPSYIPSFVPSAVPSLAPTVQSVPTFPPTPTRSPTFSSPTYSPTLEPSYMPVSFSCSPGFFMLFGTSNLTSICTPCAVGTYDNTIGQAASCSSCAVGYTSPPFATACTPCPVGFYGYATQCLQCPAGTYSDPTGR